MNRSRAIFLALAAFSFVFGLLMGSFTSLQVNKAEASVSSSQGDVGTLGECGLTECDGGKTPCQECSHRDCCGVCRNTDGCVKFDFSCTTPNPPWTCKV